MGRRLPITDSLAELGFPVTSCDVRVCIRASSFPSRLYWPSSRCRFAGDSRLWSIGTQPASLFPAARHVGTGPDVAAHNGGQTMETICGGLLLSRTARMLVLLPGMRTPTPVLVSLLYPLANGYAVVGTDSDAWVIRADDVIRYV